MRRLILLVLACLMPLCALAESLPECTTAAEVMQHLLLPSSIVNGQFRPREVQQGAIRYISQSITKDRRFCPAYWQGGIPGDDLDLTLQKAADTGKPYGVSVGNMCTRAAYSMALSFLGIDCTPGDMSRMLQTRDIDDPYDDISSLLGVERITYKSNILKKMYANYTSDTAHYSPVYVYLEKPSGAFHALLIVGREEDTGRYLMVDPSVHISDDQPVYVYSMSFSINVRTVVNSTFRNEYKDSKILKFYQWYKP